MTKKSKSALPWGSVALACSALVGFIGFVGNATASSAISTESSVTARNEQITPAQRQMAQAARNGVDVHLLAKGAPTSYTVKPGDTLWGIAGVFLKSPWHWPALWGLNLAEIKNPHLIYPGEVLDLEIHEGTARLRRAGMKSQDVRLSPKIRISDQMDSSIQTIKFANIASFLTKPVMVDSDLFLNSATVFATKDNRLNVGSGGRLYAAGIREDASVGDVFSLYRPGRAVKDPDVLDKKDPKALLGVEAIFLGEARLVKKDPVTGVATLEVTNATQEIGKGDRLLSMSKQTQFQIVPHATKSDFQGRVVMMHDGRTGTSLLVNAQQARPYETEGGPLSIVVINRGTNDGLETGHVLKLVRPEKTIEERSSMGYLEGRKLAAPQSTPAEEYGTVMVFKTFSKISYAIVMDSSTSVLPGDEVVGTKD